MSNTKFRSLIDELSDYAPSNNKDLFIEGRAEQVMASVKHLMRLIRESYDEETSDDLVKRLVSSIKNEDEGKFRRGIRQLRENRK